VTRRWVEATAPVRICDAGGWTDTWFAGHGAVCSVAIDPGVRVEVAVRQRAGAAAVVHALDLPDVDRHPLLEAAVAEAALPDDVGIEAWITSAVPPGAGTGTSASVTVALLGALAAAAGRDVDPAAIAAAAHRVEVERLGLQSGVQDQLAAAHGGICWIEIDPYPEVRVTPVVVDDATVSELERRLLLVYLGRGHASSAVHEQVIAGLTPAAPPLEALRSAAAAARRALEAGDLDAYGAALAANTAAQRDLHPALISPDAQRVADAAAACGAVAWKVNGAGGDGGSVGILCDPALAAIRATAAAVGALDPDFRVTSVRLNRDGLRVWDRP